jgi:hypothetical protein
MEDPGVVAASSTPAATTVSAELDAMFEDVSSEATETEAASPETETTTSETIAQDSTVQPRSPESDDEPAIEAADTDTTTTEVAKAPLEATPVPEDERGGEEYEVRGKKWIRYPEARGREVYAGYQAAKSLSRELGLQGPVTPEAVKALASDKQLLDAIDFDVMSSDPVDQAKAFRYLFTTAKKAHDAGHTAHNPHETMADAMLHAAATAAPEVIQGIEQRVNSHTFDKLYQKALAAGLDTEAGRDLLASVQRADQALTGTFRKKAEVAAQQQAADPLAVRAQELDKQENRIRQYEAEQAEAAQRQWDKATNAAIETGVSGSIAATIKPVVASLKNFPQTQKNVEIRLREEIKTAFLSDPKFKVERDRYFKQANIAGTEQIRDGWRARIVQLYTSRAEQVLREKAPAILSESAMAIKAKSDKTHERLKGTQQLRGTPAGGSSPNGTTGPPSGSEKFDSKSWAREIDAAFN